METNIEEYTQYEITCPIVGIMTFDDSHEFKSILDLCNSEKHDPTIKKRQVLVETKTTPWEEVKDEV